MLVVLLFKGVYYSMTNIFSWKITTTEGLAGGEKGEGAQNNHCGLSDMEIPDHMEFFLFLLILDTPLLNSLGWIFSLTSIWI
jgi:hypothetical protein